MSDGTRELSGLRAPLLAAFLAAALIPVLLLSFPLFTQVQRLLQSSAERELILKSQAAAGQVENEIEATLTRALSLATDAEIQRAVRVPFFSPKADRAIRSYLDHNRSASAVYLLDSRGRMVSAAPPSLVASSMAPAMTSAVADRCLDFRALKNGFSPYYAYPNDLELARGESSLVLTIPVFNSTLEVWSGALCLVLPWRNVARAAISRLNPQPLLSNLFLDEKGLLRPDPASSGREAAGMAARPDTARVTAPIASQAFGIEAGRLTAEVAEPRALWLAEFYNTLASFILIATALIAVVGWGSFWILSRAMQPGRRVPGTARGLPISLSRTVIPLFRPEKTE